MANFFANLGTSTAQKKTTSTPKPFVSEKFSIVAPKSTNEPLVGFQAPQTQQASSSAPLTKSPLKGSNFFAKFEKVNNTLKKVKTGVDIVTNPVAGIAQTKTAQNFLKEAGQGTARTVASVALTAMNPLLKAKGQQPIHELEEARPGFPREVQKTVFGEGKVQDIPTKVAEVSQKLEKYGINPDVSNPLAFAGVAGMTAADLTGFGGEGKLATTLAKEADAKVIGGILKKLGTADEFIPKFAERIAKLTKPEEVKAALKELKNLKPEVSKIAKDLEPLAQEARKYKSAEEFVKKIQNESNISQQGKLQTIPLNKIRGSDYPELDAALKKGKLSLQDAQNLLPDNEIDMANSKVSMPIEVIKNSDGTYTLQAGNHRVAQQLVNGEKTIFANVANEKGFSTASQLTDIYNQATKGASNLDTTDNLGGALKDRKSLQSDVPSTTKIPQQVRVSKVPLTQGADVQNPAKSLESSLAGKEINAPSTRLETQVGVQGAEEKIRPAVSDIAIETQKSVIPLKGTLSTPKTSLSAKLGLDSSLPTKYTIQEKNAIETTARQMGEPPGKVRRLLDSTKKIWTNVVEYVQNSEERVRQLVNRKDVKITDASDPYLKSTLYSGRVAERVNQGKEEVKSIIGEMKKTADEFKTTLATVRKEVNEYLHLRHAPERNLALGDGAAGVTTKEAQTRLSAIENSSRGAIIKKLADKAQKLNERTLDVLKESGVISDELHATLRTKYKNHVPLQRIFEETDDVGAILSGRGYDVKSTGLKKAVGSQREVDDILANISTNYEQAVIRSEKNIVDQATLAFVRNNKEELAGLLQEVKLPIIPVAKVTHKGQVFGEVMDKISEIVHQYGGQMERKLKTGRLFGKYSSGENKITTRFGTSKDTLLHEFGHMLDNKFGLGETEFFNRETLVELRKVADLRKGRQAYVRKGEEKIAEFVSMYFSDSKNAQKVAPITTRKFTQFLKDKPELRELVDVMSSRSRVDEFIEETIFARQQFTTDPTILTMRENGKETYIKINDPHLAVALKGMGREKLPGILRAVGSFTRVYSGLATRFNPEFALPNKIRDLQETAIYLASQKGIGFKGAAKTVARDLKQQNTLAVIDYLRGKNTPGAKLYEELKSMGGTTGGFGLSTREQTKVSIEHLEKLANSRTRRITDTLVEYIDNWNTIFEDSTRLSVYRQALDSGLSKERAAFLAKEASINFNRMGKGGPIINALWMFSNASIQGSAKMLRSLKNPKVLGTTLATVGASVGAVNEWNDHADPEWRDKVSKWDRLNGLPVVIPKSDGGFRYFTIPVSWGIKPIKVTADYAYDAIAGYDFEIKKFMGDTVTAMIEAYNPTGGSDLVSSFTPTILDVPVEIARNRSWSGNKIKPDFDPNAPQDIRYFDSLKDTKTGQVAISLSEALQKYTSISISPADIKYSYDQYIGGVGRAMSKTLNVGIGIAKGDVPSLDEFPMISRFYKERTEEEVGSGAGGQTQKIKDILERQSRERFFQKSQAEEFVDSMKGKSPEEIKNELLNLAKQNPKIVDDIKDIMADKSLGLTYQDRLVKQLGVSNGERAEYILQEMKSLKSSDERKAYLLDLAKKKILTKDVIKQMAVLSSQK